MKRGYHRSCCWVLLLVMFTGCGEVKEEANDASGLKPLSVYVVNYPLKYFAERIGGAFVDVQLPAPTDEDPAYWSPTVETLAAYQQADLIILNGAGYAKWISKVSLPSSKLIDTSKPFHDRLIRIEEQSTHTHGPEGEHVHGEVAFTTWLDLELAVEQARVVKDAIAAELPDSRTLLDDRFAKLEYELLEVDRQLMEQFSMEVRRPLVFSHPVYQYLERRYEVDGMSVHWEPNEAPTEEMLAKLKELLAKHPATWMVWESAPDSETAALLKELGVGSVVFAPCATPPPEGDLLSVMRENVRELRRTSETP